MKQNQQTKEYNAPKFQLVRHGESNKVFFVASGAPTVGGSLGSMSSTTSAW